ncbi:hypothetical protein [Embleya sp. NPDC050493]|uniref:hypothetical protein n=1 Tax=Embleya sp. NPDC050493 TaxID=3363989 RepID=UPI00378E9D85
MKVFLPLPTEIWGINEEVITKSSTPEWLRLRTCHEHDGSVSNSPLFDGGSALITAAWHAPSKLEGVIRMSDSRSEIIKVPGEDLLVTIETLGSVHDRNDADRSDPPPDATGDTQPDGDGLNYPA